MTGRSLKKGPFVDEHLLAQGRDGQRQRREAGHPDLESPLHDHPRDGRSHDRRSRWAQARSRLHQRIDGGPQARRVRPDADLSWPRRRAGREKPMKTRAHARFIRQSPYKVRRVLDLVRGLPVNDARVVLELHEPACRRSNPEGAWIRPSPTPSTTWRSTPTSSSLPRRSPMRARRSSDGGPVLAVERRGSASERAISRSSSQTNEEDA